MKNKNINVIRWILFGPAVLATWYVIVRAFGLIPHWLYRHGLEGLIARAEILLAIIFGFLLPCMVVYFVAKYIAPTHKKTAGWTAVVLCLIWKLLLVLGIL